MGFESLLWCRRPREGRKSRGPSEHGVPVSGASQSIGEVAPWCILSRPAMALHPRASGDHEREACVVQHPTDKARF